MITADAYCKILCKQRVLPIFYADDRDFCIAAAKTLYQAGVRTIEFTNRGDKALQNFRALAEEAKKTMPEMVLAIGTIKTPEDVRDFLQSGAQVLISPFYDDALDLETKKNNTLWIPGAMSVREIQLARSTHISLIKLFPGNVLTKGFVEAIKPLFEDAKFLVTGGVEATDESITSWIDSGVIAVGMGSKLITKDIIAKKDTEILKQGIENLMQIVKLYNENKS